MITKHWCSRLLAGVAIMVAAASCQKMDKPVMRPIIEDPAPPPYNELKSFWAFENNLNDQGESQLTATPVGVTYVPGVTGQAAQIGAGGYILLKVLSDTVRYPNEFVSFPSDTLSNLNSFTVAFWMKGTGPVQGGAQGLFAISNKTQFWGNLEVFLENNNNVADPSEAFIKIHMLNANISGGGEQWNELKVPGVLNKWTHVAITYDASNASFSLYKDGAPTAIANKILDNGNYGPVKFSDFNGVVLGSFAFQTTPSLTNHGPEDWAKSFNGALDQFRIYNRPLTGGQIAELFESKK